MGSHRPAPFRPEQLWQLAREPTFWLDPGLRIVWVNRSWEALTGHPAESVVGIACSAHGPTRGDDPADVAASLMPPIEVLEGKPAGTLTILLRAGGERLWKRIEYWPFQGSDGALIGILGQIRDPQAPASVPEARANLLRVRLLSLREQLHQRFGFDALIGSGTGHQRLLEQIRLAAGSRVPVLVRGEAGTGKRLVARLIHHHGPHADRPLLALDCEALPAEVLERELFHPRARFEGSTSGDGSTPPAPGGNLAMAEGSTLLLSEVLALPRDLQARLARSLDGRVRLIATTAGDPEAALEREQLQSDFYDAVTVLVIQLASLRQRRQDLPLLAQHLLERANQREGAACAGFTARALSAIEAYDWPGNVRELARVIDDAHARAIRSGTSAPGTRPIELDDLPAAIRGNLGAAYLPPSPPVAVKPLDELLTEIERRLIESALARARQNKSRAAGYLGISRPRLYRRMKELGFKDDSEAVTRPSPPKNQGSGDPRVPHP